MTTNKANPLKAQDKATLRGIEFRDQKRLRALGRELSVKFRMEICTQAAQLDVPTVKYKTQYLLEEIVADMERFI